MMHPKKKHMMSEKEMGYKAKKHKKGKKKKGRYQCLSKVKNKDAIYGVSILIQQGGGLISMDQESNGEKRGKLDDLPPSNDDFWQFADKHYKRVVKKEECKHYFERINSIEAMCNKCNAGFQISLGFEVKNGHIILHGELII